MAYDHGQEDCGTAKAVGSFPGSIGERIGVSRQAIFKWEADGAIPEIDKLIVLRKRFRVSVGWFLYTLLRCRNAELRKQHKNK